MPTILSLQQREEAKNKKNNKASTNPAVQDLEDLFVPSVKTTNEPKPNEGKQGQLRVFSEHCSIGSSSLVALKQ